MAHTARPWTAEEDALLLSLAAYRIRQGDAECLAERIGRPRAQVRRRRRTLRRTLRRTAGLAGCHAPWRAVDRALGLTKPHPYGWA